MLKTKVVARCGSCSAISDRVNYRMDTEIGVLVYTDDAMSEVLEARRMPSPDCGCDEPSELTDLLYLLDLVRERRAMKVADDFGRAA